VKPQTSGKGPQPCFTAAVDAEEGGAHTANTVGSAYGFSSLYRQGDRGSGQTVALYELQGYGADDIATYQSCFKTHTAVTTIHVDGGPTARSGVGEADVDIEQLVTLAPEAHILVYEGPNDGAGGYDTYSSIIGQDTARVVSTSWGLCEPYTGYSAAEAENTLFEEAAIQGQSIVAAAGDEGSEDCLGNTYTNSTGELAVDDPSSQPYVTGAGGTQWNAFKDNTPTEAAWNDGVCCWGAGGGGVSRFWAMPWYQADSEGIGVVNAGSSGTPCREHVAAGDCREVPDVSALAGPYPYLDYVNGSWGGWGGTSLVAPLWAALLTLSNGSAACHGKDIGFANPILYDVAVADPDAFNDVTTGDNDLTGKHQGTYPALVGYDMATGLGTPNASVLPADLCSYAPVDPVSVSNPGNQTAQHSASVGLQVHATDATHGQQLTYRAVGLPTGLTIDATTGLISGILSGWGSSHVVLRARATSGATDSVNFVWVVNVALTSAPYATATIDRSFTFTVTTTGVPTKLTMTTAPPAGLSFVNRGNGTATLSGTPSDHDGIGRHQLTLRAAFGTGKTADVVYQVLTLTLIR
jgi:subtilase family serine protease